MFKKLFIIVPFLFINTLFAQVLDYAQEASKRPIAFSIVREDSEQDLEVIKRYFSEEKISMLMVASGGCTAAELAAKAPLAELTLVDPNPAQLALTKIKMQLLMLPTQKRLEILGYAQMNPEERKVILIGLMHALEIDEKVFGDIDQISQEGLDFAGKYEKVFEELRGRLAPYEKELEALFDAETLDQQQSLIDPTTTFGKGLDEAFDTIMSQDNLVALFGEKATANRVQDFSRHFAERTRIYLSSHLASESPWMAHLLLGYFTEENHLPWLDAKLSHPLPNITYEQGFMDAILEKSESEKYHVIHLSNIIDWLSPQEAEKTLNLAFRALKPGGVVIIRQLNSNIDIPCIGNQFQWDHETSNEFLHEDRSFFYRNFYLGFKPHICSAPVVKAMADQVLTEIPVIRGKYFKSLSSISKERFQESQTQFFFAVDYFSRPMAALIARFPQHKDRIDILHNMVEEHGDFNVEHYHSNTFKKFLSTIGVNEKTVQSTAPCSGVNAFNYTLMGVCANEDPIIAVACNGIIEYAFADISAHLAKVVVEKGWVEKQDLVHYNLHANIDKRHAEEFFKIIEPYANDEEGRQKILAGLRLGAHIFNHMYDEM